MEENSGGWSDLWELRTIAGQLVRKLERKLSAERLKVYEETFGIFKGALACPYINTMVF